MPPVVPDDEEELLDEELEELLDELLEELEELLEELEELLELTPPLEASLNACIAAAGRLVLGFHAPRV